MNKKDQRIKHILDLLQVKNVISIKELTKQLYVSEMTIRRDLMLLSSDNLVELIPGGAILKPHSEIEKGEENYLITHEETRRSREKAKIGKKAASMIEPNDTIILDAGSTVEYIAKFIWEELPVTILCHALNVLVELYRKKNCHLIFAGGYFHPNTLVFESQEGIILIGKTRADKAFMAASGVSEQLGVTCINPYELEIKKAILKSAKTKILAVDSTKFGKVKIAYFADLQEFDMVITDDGISEEYRAIIRNLGLELHVV